MTLFASALLLALAQPPPPQAKTPEPRPPFAWSIPDVVEEFPIGGTQVVGVRPMRLRSVRTRLTGAPLWKKLTDDFQKAGLFVTPPRLRKLPLSMPYISAVDGIRRISYSALVQENHDGTTTLILGEVDLDARVNVVSPAPTFPGATQIVTSDVEALKIVSYQAPASPAAVDSFYTEVLQRAGYRRASKEVFVRQGEALSVYMAGTDAGTTTVTVHSMASPPQAK
jgi:hypothetical protein